MSKRIEAWESLPDELCISQGSGNTLPKPHIHRLEYNLCTETTLLKYRVPRKALLPN